MTNVQIFTGGELINPEAIKAAGVRVMFSANVDGWVEPPAAPVVEASIKAADMPPSIRKVLADAMCKVIEQATGFKFKQV